ncbi:hypothetical protein C8J57DRAFT_1730681 [Mycena rebaudengoi]|nr:hypothetical protein C8J57DRAFT_1730681 [Mycena rebaudengoi]
MREQHSHPKKSSTASEQSVPCSLLPANTSLLVLSNLHLPETAQHPLVQNTYLNLHTTYAPPHPAHPHLPSPKHGRLLPCCPPRIPCRVSAACAPPRPTAQLRKLDNPLNPPAGSPPRCVSQLRPPASAAPPSTHTARSEHTEHPISRRPACVRMFVPTSRSTTTIEDPNAETLDISPSYHLRSILGSGQQLRFLRAFLATPPSPPLSAFLDHLIRVPNDRRPRAILQHTFQLKIWDPARPPFHQSRATRAQPYPASQRAVLPSLVVVAGWTSLGISIEGKGGVLGIYGARRSMTPLFPGSKQLATSHLRTPCSDSTT